MRLIIFESHSTTTDNEAGLASGHFDALLSAQCTEQARALGARRKEQFDLIYCSQLRRSYETAALAFPTASVIRDARLNEMDYRLLTRANKRTIERDKRSYIDRAYPQGESYTDAIRRVVDYVDSVLREAAKGPV